MSEIDISDCDKVEVLRALYARAQPLGLGALHYKPGPLSREEASEMLAAAGERAYFDYVRGRVMKVGLGGPVLRVHLYDRDNGQGAAHEALVRAGLIKPADETMTAPASPKTTTEA